MDAKERDGEYWLHADITTKRIFIFCLLVSAYESGIGVGVVEFLNREIRNFTITDHQHSSN